MTIWGIFQALTSPMVNFFGKELSIVIGATIIILFLCCAIHIYNILKALLKNNKTQYKTQNIGFEFCCELSNEKIEFLPNCKNILSKYSTPICKINGEDCVFIYLQFSSPLSNIHNYILTVGNLKSEIVFYNFNEKRNLCMGIVLKIWNFNNKNREFIVNFDYDNT